MALIGYARVSSVSQDLDVQLVKPAHCHKVSQEKHSGASIVRPRLKACLEYIRKAMSWLSLTLSATCETLDGPDQATAMSNLSACMASIIDNGNLVCIPDLPQADYKNSGRPVIGFNPYLEAGFDPGVFQIFRPINGKIKNEYGVQTNCMTCHNLAAYDSSVDYSQPGNRKKPYAADFYLGIDDPVFKGKLKLDFTWLDLGGNGIGPPIKLLTRIFHE